MSRQLTIIGGLVSPYVRKVLAICELKGLPYRIDPIIPFFGDAAFARVSPLRRIPVLIDKDVTLCDSSVICQYLEDSYPDPPAYPREITARARARWLEEFADTRMADVMLWRIFNEAVIRPGVWGKPRDLAAIRHAVDHDLPDVMGYLESTAPAEGFAFGPASIADVSVAVFFRNLRWSRITPEAARWPRTMAWVERVETLPFIEKLSWAGDRMVRTPPAAQRALCAELGFAVTEHTFRTDVPQRGPMSV